MKLIKCLNRHLEEVVVAVLLGYLSIMTVIQVIARYVFGRSLFWSEETIRYSFIWLVFIGISMGVKKRAHIRILSIFSLVSQQKKIALTVLANLIFMGFAVIVTVIGVQQVLSFAQFPQTSSALRIPMQYVYLACPVGMALTAVRLLQDNLLLMKTRELEIKE